MTGQISYSGEEINLQLEDTSVTSCWDFLLLEWLVRIFVQSSFTQNYPLEDMLEKLSQEIIFVNGFRLWLRSYNWLEVQVKVMVSLQVLLFGTTETNDGK